MSRLLLRKNLKHIALKRKQMKFKRKQINLLDKKGNNYPVNVDKLKNWKNRFNKDYPFLL